MFNVLKKNVINLTKSNTLRTSLNAINSIKLYSDTITEKLNENDTENVKKISGFAKAFEKHSSSLLNEAKPEENLTFASLLKNSKFVDLGDPEGKIVLGKVYHVVGDDLYIDFGWKFHCVCVRPAKNGSEYVRGSKVRLRIKSLELSSRFLGSSKDLTILEADCQLLSLISSPARKSQSI